MISIGERLKSIGGIENVTARYYTLTAALEHTQWIAPVINSETNSVDQKSASANHSVDYLRSSGFLRPEVSTSANNGQASTTYDYYPGQSGESARQVDPTAINATDKNITSIRNEVAAIIQEIESAPDIPTDQDLRGAA